MLQKELDSITGTLHQLENQKKEAQKCLDELDENVCILSIFDLYEN
jgi:prefoldin subunit 5